MYANEPLSFATASDHPAGGVNVPCAFDELNRATNRLPATGVVANVPTILVPVTEELGMSCTTL